MWAIFVRAPPGFKLGEETSRTKMYNRLQFIFQVTKYLTRYAIHEILL